MWPGVRSGWGVEGKGGWSGQAQDKEALQKVPAQACKMVTCGRAFYVNFTCTLD